MTWMFPLYLLGIAAVGGPLLFHLWRRIPRGRLPFSTLLFLSPAPPTLTRRSRIEHWPLLLLRAAAVILLAIAFSRPVLRTVSAVVEPATDRQVIAILVDTSASLRREELWPRLQAEVRQRIEQLPANVHLGLFAVSDQLRPLVGFESGPSLEPGTRRQLVLQALEECGPDWGSSQLGTGLAQVLGVVQEYSASLPAGTPQQIWLASDLQQGANVSALQQLDWPEEVSVQLITMQPRLTTNAAIHRVEQATDRRAELATEGIRVRVMNSADAVKSRFQLRWQTADGPSESAVEVTVPPGQSRIVRIDPPSVNPAEAPSGAPAADVWRLVLTGDDHDFDNQLTICPPRPEPVRIVYCGSEADTPDHARFYLKRVLGATTRFSCEWELVADPDQTPLPDQATQQSPELIVWTDGWPGWTSTPVEQRDSWASQLATWIRQGTLVLAAPTTEESLSQLLQLLEVPASDVRPAESSRYAMLTELDFDHPWLKPFAEGKFADFTGIHVWKHRQWQLPAETKARVLGRFDDRTPALVELPVAAGTVLLMTTSWTPADSQWARSTKFPPLIYRAVELALGTENRRPTRQVGQPISFPWRVPASLASAQVTLPDGTKRPWDPRQPFTDTQLPGHYEFRAGERSTSVALELAPDESRTTPMEIEAWQRLGLKATGGAVSAARVQHLAARERQRQLIELEETQRLWRSVIILALCLLAAEMLWSQFVTGRASST